MSVLKRYGSGIRSLSRAGSAASAPPPETTSPARPPVQRSATAEVDALRTLVAEADEDPYATAPSVEAARTPPPPAPVTAANASAAPRKSALRDPNKRRRSADLADKVSPRHAHLSVSPHCQTHVPPPRVRRLRCRGPRSTTSACRTRTTRSARPWTRCSTWSTGLISHHQRCALVPRPPAPRSVQPWRCARFP